ncbi:MAG TPA: hydantoinase/oxoprolinase N-terminal domain-containing protein, partial [Candidatus Limnocylindria bacterium]|nr:hydantoinase/oxoprolinase N-terminal domain-containing protein [Candidatus Limnocylindria bacterium]
MTPRPVLVGVDTGGTFTDLVAVVGGRLRVLKVRSTPRDPAV